MGFVGSRAWAVRRIVEVDPVGKIVPSTMLEPPRKDPMPDVARTVWGHGPVAIAPSDAYGMAGYRSARDVLFYHSDPALAYGIVNLYGRVVECERGWYASHALVQAIYLKQGFHSTQVCRHLADLYQCPVMVLNPALVDMASIINDHVRELQHG